MANLKQIYDEYKLQLDKNKLTAQNELNKATSKSRTYLNNYLKAMGLEGSGIGASVGANIGTNYASKMAEINADYDAQKLSLDKQYQTDLQAQKETQNAQTMNNLQTYLAGNTTKGEQQAYVDRLTNDPTIDNSLKTQIQDYYNAYGITWKNDRDNDLANLQTQIENTTSSGTKKSLQELYNSLNSASTEEEYNKIYNDYYEKANNSLKTEYGVKESDKGIDNSTATSTSFGTFFRGDKSDSNQARYVKAIISSAKQGKIPDGTTIDMNYGAGNNNAIYMYIGGKWYKTDLNKESKADYTHKNITDLIGEYK